MAQIKKGFIAPNAIDGSKLRLLNNEAIRALAADGSDVELMKIDLDSVLQFLRVPQVSSDPTSGNDLARKSYTDNYTDTAVAAEQSARESAINSLQSAVNSLSLDSLTDVTMSSPGSGDVLRYDGLYWIKETPSEERQVSSGGGGSTQTISFLDETPGTLETQAPIDNWSPTTEKNGQTFGGVSGQLTSFTWVLRRPSSTVSGSLKVLIYEYNSTTRQPTGDVLATSDLIAKQTLPISSTVDTNVQFVFSSPPTLDSAKKYVAFIAAENASSSGMYDVVAYRSWYDYNGYDRINFNGAEWSYGNQSFRHIYTVQTGGGQSSPVGNLIIQSNVDGFLDESFLQYNVNFGDNKLSGVSAPEAGTDAANKTWVEGQVAAEQSARETADSNLQGAIDVEKGRIDAILLAADADKDSFAEIVQLINSVDTDNDSAFASYVLSNDAALAQEVSNRQAGDSALQSNLDAEESAREAADSTLQSNIDAEAAARLAADNDLQDAIDQEVSARQAAVSAEESARQSAISAEQAARQAEDAALDARLDVLEADPTTKTYVDEADQDLQDQIDALVISTGGDTAAEAALRLAGDANLQSQVDTEKARIDAILNAATADADSFKEIVDLINSVDTENDSAFASYVLSNNAALAAEQAAREAADAAEQAAREAADSALDVRVGALEAVVDGRAKFTITQTDLDNQYLDLSHEAKPDSTFMFYGPLYLHEGDDYTVSTVGGVSRLAFSGRIASGQPSQPIVGDVIYVRYKY